LTPCNNPRNACLTGKEYGDDGIHDVHAARESER
jgi:hypothetical protein